MSGSFATVVYVGQFSLFVYNSVIGISYPAVVFIPFIVFPSASYSTVPYFSNVVFNSLYVIFPPFSICISVMSNWAFSFTSAISVLVLLSLLLVRIPSLFNTKFKLTPAKINKTTIVTTKATNVIPPSYFLFFSFSIHFLPSFSFVSMIYFIIPLFFKLYT